MFLFFALFQSQMFLFLFLQEKVTKHYFYKYNQIRHKKVSIYRILRMYLLMAMIVLLD